MMADASARLTGRPGIAMVTRGPGATNASPGIHIAEHDSVPLILFVGQIDSAMRHRGAFQEMDYRAFFGATAKWVVELDDAAHIPEVVAGLPCGHAGAARAGHRGAARGRAARGCRRRDAPRRVKPAPTWPGQTQMAELQKLLWASQRPIAILGGSGWNAKARASFTRFAERFDLPVACSFRRQMLFSGDHPNYAGEIGVAPNPKLRARIDAADLVLLIGGRMAGCRRSPTRCSTFPIRGRHSCMSTPMRANSAGSIIRRLQSARRHWRSGRARKPRAAAASRLGAAGGRSARRLSRLERSQTRHTGRPADGRMHGLPARASPADAIVTNGAGNFYDLAGALPEIPLVRRAARAMLGLDGLRRARRRRRQARRAGPHGRLLRRRRLLPDEWTGVRDRGSVRSCGDLHRRRQRHVRDDPHASGARISGTRFATMCAIPISPLMRAPSAAMAKRCAARPTSRRRSSARSRREPAFDPACQSIPKRSRQPRPCRPSARRRLEKRSSA